MTCVYSDTDGEIFTRPAHPSHHIVIFTRPCSQPIPWQEDGDLFDEQEGELHHYAARLAGGP